MIRVGSSSLGSLSHWYIDVPVENGDIHSMGFWGFSPKIYISDTTGNSMFSNYLNSIVTQLVLSNSEEFNGMTITTNESLADIVIRGVETLGNNKVGITIPNHSQQVYTADYQGQSKQIKEIVSANIQILESTNYNQLQNTILHEIWHALGYLGHSSNTNDIMYKSSQSSNASQLSQRDIDQLLQIYPLILP